MGMSEQDRLTLTPLSQTSPSIDAQRSKFPSQTPSPRPSEGSRRSLQVPSASSPSRSYSSYHDAAPTPLLDVTPTRSSDFVPLPTPLLDVTPTRSSDFVPPAPGGSPYMLSPRSSVASRRHSVTLADTSFVTTSLRPSVSPEQSSGIQTPPCEMHSISTSVFQSPGIQTPPEMRATSAVFQSSGIQTPPEMRATSAVFQSSGIQTPPEMRAISASVFQTPGIHTPPQMRATSGSVFQTPGIHTPPQMRATEPPMRPVSVSPPDDPLGHAAAYMEACGHTYDRESIASSQMATVASTTRALLNEPAEASTKSSANAPSESDASRPSMFPVVFNEYPDFRRSSRRSRLEGDPFHSKDRHAILTGGVVPTPQVTPHLQAKNLGRNAHRLSDGLQRHATSRIDPEQIPRPSTINVDAVKDVGGKIFDTNKYTNPPNVQNACRIMDKGSASCRYIRMTTNQVPITTATANLSHVIVGCVCQPFAELQPKEYPVEVVDLGEKGPFRCPRCASYVNAYYTWTSGGREAICNMCGHYMRVPSHYLCSLDENGKRRDHGERIELMRGTVDYVAPAEYSDFTPTVPAILFLLDCTHISVTSKFFSLALDAISKLTDYLPAEETEICIVTYDTSIHFYCLSDKAHAVKPAEMVTVSDYSAPFAPVSAGRLFFNPRDEVKGPHFQKLVTSVLPRMFQSTKLDSHCGNAALRACTKLLASRGGGQILYFASSLPRLGVGSLVVRDDMPMYSSSPRSKDMDKIFEPQNPELFQKWADKANRKHVAVDLFLASRPNAYVDVASMGYIPRKTGGYVHFYRHFDAEVDSEKFGYDIARSCVPKVTAYSCIFRLRSSVGLSVESSYAPFDIDEHTCHVAKMTPDTSLAFIFQNDESLEMCKNVYIQVACLHTNIHGQRLIRVQTLLVQTTSSLSNTFKHTCIDTYTNIMLKRIASSVMRNDYSWKERMQKECVNVLHSYRMNCSASTQYAQLILPEALKMLPLFVSNTYKMPCFRHQSSEIRIDQRVAELIKCLGASILFTQAWLYPRIYPVHNLTEKAGTRTGVGDNVFLPHKIAASIDKVTAAGAYLADNGFHICFFIGAEVSNVFLKDVFDVHQLPLSPADINLEPVEGHLSARIYSIIEQLRKDKASHPWLPLKIVFPNTLEENRFFRLLIEDRCGGESSYVDYLCKIHKLVQEKLE